MFRGTNDLRNWLSNLNALPERWPVGGKVHQGFVDVLDKVWAEVEAAVAAWGGPVVYTGHSLGAALATLAASRRAPAALYSFGSPRVGDEAFGRTLDHVPVHRVVNSEDVVATVPPSIGSVEFRHVGVTRHLRYDDAPERRWFDPPPAMTLRWMSPDR